MSRLIIRNFLESEWNMLEKFGTVHEYFASANSFDGFKSYFRSVFNSRNFTKVYVLKGGPGTGKSSILKKICRLASSLNYSFEVYRCSSDVNSLDGVIVENRERRIAFVDGTAPHERDAVIPGCIDNIINLGCAWDELALTKERENILSLCELKTAAYKNAYIELSKNSVYSRKFKAELQSIVKNDKLEIALDSALKRLEIYGKSKKETKLISSFSKDGYRTLDTISEISSRNLCICGSLGMDRIFLSALAERLAEKSIPFVRIPSPLDSESLEAIHFTDSKITVNALSMGEVLCDSDELFERNRLDDYFAYYKEGEKMFLKKAAERLEEASKYHFELEKIYTESMDFNILDEITRGILENAKKILE